MDVAVAVAVAASVGVAVGGEVGVAVDVAVGNAVAVGGSGVAVDAATVAVGVAGGAVGVAAGSDVDEVHPIKLSPISNPITQSNERVIFACIVLLSLQGQSQVDGAIENDYNENILQNNDEKGRSHANFASEIG